MDNADKLKIYKLMCSNAYQLGVHLFKSNDLDFDEFVDWVLNYGEWVDNKYWKHLPHLFYYREVYVLDIRVKYRCGTAIVISIDHQAEFRIPLKTI